MRERQDPRNKQMISSKANGMKYVKSKKSKSRDSGERRMLTVMNIQKVKRSKYSKKHLIGQSNSSQTRFPVVQIHAYPGAPFIPLTIR